MDTILVVALRLLNPRWSRETGTVLHGLAGKCMEFGSGNQPRNIVTDVKSRYYV